jgi:aquaporin Z
MEPEAAITPRRRWRHPPLPGLHLAEWTCELVGTGILILGGLSAIVFDFGRGSPVASALPSQSARLLLTGAIFAGFAALVMISPLGRRSGAHLNPALSLAFWSKGHLHRDDLVGYVAAQTLGAILATVIVRVAWGGRAASVSYGVTGRGRGFDGLEVVVVEALMTALLILTIFAFVSSARTARWTPLAVWVVITILVWQVGAYTGTSLNPARSLGPALVADDWREYWEYLLGPFLGAALAAAAWTFIPRETLTAKLFHDRRYTCTLGTQLPARR